MSRCPALPSRPDIPESEQPLYDEVIERRLSQGHHPYWPALLNSPPLAWRLAGGVGFLSTDLEGCWSPEWILQVVEVEFNDSRTLARRTPSAIAAGVRPGAIEAVRDGRDDLLEGDEKSLTLFIRQVLRGEVTDSSFSWLTSLLGVRRAVEYTAAINWLAMVVRNHQAFDVRYPSAAEELP